MNFLKKMFLGRQTNSASVAKERLQIVISHQRTQAASRDYLPLLQRDLIAVIAKYTHIDEKHVCVSLDQKDNCSILELNITLPNMAEEAVV